MDEVRQQSEARLREMEQQHQSQLEQLHSKHSANITYASSIYSLVPGLSPLAIILTVEWQ